MKINKIVAIIMIFLITINIVGCSNREQIEEESYVKYIITIYSGGKEIDTFEVYSDMGWIFNENSVTIWDSPSEEVLLFYSTLDYKLEPIGHKN